MSSLHGRELELSKRWDGGEIEAQQTVFTTPYGKGEAEGTHDRRRLAGIGDAIPWRGEMRKILQGSVYVPAKRVNMPQA